MVTMLDSPIKWSKFYVLILQKIWKFNDSLIYQGLWNRKFATFEALSNSVSNSTNPFCTVISNSENY